MSQPFLHSCNYYYYYVYYSLMLLYQYMFIKEMINSVDGKNKK